MKPVAFKGEIYSPEYKRYFKTERSVAEIKPNPKEPNKYELTIDGVDNTNWFRQKQKEFLETLGIDVKSKEESKGIRR